MSLPKRNSADGRCYWMKPEVQEELQPLFDQCIQDAIDGRITRLDSLWPPVVVSSEGAPFEVWQLLQIWTEAQRAETLDAEKAIAFSENLRRQSRWGEIDHHLLDMLKRELQEKYFVVTGNEDDHFWDREYSLKPGIRAEEVPEPLLRFACYVIWGKASAKGGQKVVEAAPEELLEKYQNIFSQMDVSLGGTQG